MPVRPSRRSLKKGSMRELGARTEQAFRFRGRKSLRGARTSTGRAHRVEGVHWIVVRDWAPEPDPALIVDHLRDVILAAHREAIRKGVKADGSGPQPPMKQRRRKDGRTTRGFDTGVFADNLTASPITVKGPRKKKGGVLSGNTMTRSGKMVPGTQAKSTIYMPAEARKTVKKGQGKFDLGRSSWLKREAERGVEYLFTEGHIERLIDEAVDQAIEVAFVEGGSRDARMGALRAVDTIHKS